MAGAVALTASMMVGAGAVTAVIWLFLGLTGVAKRIASWVPRPALLGVVMGQGNCFILVQRVGRHLDAPLRWRHGRTGQVRRT